MVSHGHGQGYADLNWVIPEVVGSIDTFKGPYSPLQGDFATAGSINMITHDRIDASSVSVTGGLFDTYRGLALLAPPELGGWSSYAAGELYTSDGPFLNPDYRRYSTYAKAARSIGAHGRVELSASSYMGEWNASGQIPLRAVQAGELDRFGTLDPSDGGESRGMG
jgi:hypothetical protein